MEPSPAVHRRFGYIAYGCVIVSTVTTYAVAYGFDRWNIHGLAIGGWLIALTVTLVSLVNGKHLEIYPGMREARIHRHAGLASQLLLVLPIGFLSVDAHIGGAVGATLVWLVFNAAIVTGVRHRRQNGQNQPVLDGADVDEHHHLAAHHRA